MQLLIHAPIISSRLQYICQFIFSELMQVNFLITTDQTVFKNYSGPNIKYTNEAANDGELTIGNCGLLFETNIREVDIQCFEVNKYKAFFKTPATDFPFDIFSASFYLISRYEEYLPHKKDMYGRYGHENSLAFKEHFLHLPLINIWVKHFIELLQRKFPAFSIHQSPFTFIPSYDIDMAFSYKYKGWLRNAGGFLKSPSLDRIKVLLGLMQDPFDSYNWLNELHSRHNLPALYFFLMAKENGVYDKNILPGKKVMVQMIRDHAKKYDIGIHPSWQTGDSPSLLKTEKDQLTISSQTTISKSRQHYIRFSLPAGYRHLFENSITDDYSMGYGSINGFRASVASSFYWYDLQKNEVTQLRVHPFCFMDANSYYEQKFTANEAYNELMRYYSICKEVNGQLITIWHNNFLGTDPQFAGWKEIYQDFVSEVKKESPKSKGGTIFTM
jgi:hypothetical protein